MSKYLRGNPMIRALNLLDGDAAAFDPSLVVVFGNHEFDDQDPGLVLGRVAQSDFAWVSSNTRYRSTATAPGEPFSARVRNAHDVLVSEIGGVRLGIFGLTTDAQPRDYVAYEYEPTARNAAVSRALDRLRAAGATAVVALTHQDLEEDERLARDFPAVALVVGGHEHFFLDRKVGNTWITKADADAKTAVVHDVRISADGRFEDAFRQVSLGSDVEKDPAVEKEVQASLAELAVAVRAQTGRDLQEEIGTTENLLEGVEPAVRGRETALGNFLTDVLRDRMKTDLAFVNGGAIRINDDIPPGPIRNYDFEGIFYFDNKIVSFEVTGAELLELLRISVAKVARGARPLPAGLRDPVPVSRRGNGRRAGVLRGRRRRPGRAPRLCRLPAARARPEVQRGVARLHLGERLPRRLPALLEGASSGEPAAPRLRASPVARRRPRRRSALSPGGG